MSKYINIVILYQSNFHKSFASIYLMDIYNSYDRAVWIRGEGQTKLKRQNRLQETFMVAKLYFICSTLYNLY